MLQKVTSPQIINAILYDGHMESLEIYFRNGSIARHYPVPHGVADELMRTGDAMQFYASEISARYPLDTSSRKLRFKSAHPVVEDVSLTILLSAEDIQLDEDEIRSR